MNDPLGDRMKGYESKLSDLKINKVNVIYARLDGRGFSKFTKGMNRPFDESMHQAMVDTTKALVERTNASIGYTQSDEISLIWDPVRSDQSEFMFDGKIQKLVSVLSGIATSAFTSSVAGFAAHSAFWESKLNLLPHFDCRLVELPSRTEGSNMILWRVKDAERNAISMAASAHFSHKELQNVSTADRVKMLNKINIAFEDFPPAFRHGVFVRKTPETIIVDQQFLENSAIPAQFLPLGDTFTRNVIRVFHVPDFSIVTNREGFLFDGETPNSGWAKGL